MSSFTIIATNGTVNLPPAKAGDTGTVTNGDSANSISMMPSSGEQIDSSGANVGKSIPASTTKTLSCSADGDWTTS